MLFIIYHSSYRGSCSYLASPVSPTLGPPRGEQLPCWVRQGEKGEVAGETRQERKSETEKNGGRLRTGIQRENREAKRRES